MVAIVVPLVVVLLLNKGTSSESTSTSTSAPTVKVKLPKRLCVYYGWPSLAQNANGNLTAAIGIFNQFDLIVFGDGISASSHLDHANTQTIIQGLTGYGKLSFGYVDLGVSSSTQNLSFAQMQTSVSNWAAMGVQGIMFDDAGSVLSSSLCSVEKSCILVTTTV